MTTKTPISDIKTDLTVHSKLFSSNIKLRFGFSDELEEKKSSTKELLC